VAEQVAGGPRTRSQLAAVLAERLIRWLRSPPVAA
jgi:hypothetical protein